MQTLSDEFREHFDITEVHERHSGAQKDVYIITRNGMKCALKVFRDFGERDLRELEIYRKFESLPGIPKIISVEEFEGDKIVFEKYVQGDSLEAVANKYESDGDAIKILIKKICEILKPIWEDEKVHRDLKPSNILIDPDGDPVVIDFGIAMDLVGTAATTTGFQPHTWNYASPEQVLGRRDRVNYRSDFFSLGVIAYFLYYQQLPFADTREGVQQKFAEGDSSFITDAACTLNNFFHEVFHYNQSERPRNVEFLLESLD